jgi:hypothetical protein
VQSGTRPTAVVWDDRVFTSTNQLGRWLRSRGASLAEWSAAHPAESAALQGKAFRPPNATASAATATVAAPARRSAAHGSGFDLNAGVGRSLIEATLLALAMVAVLAGSIPVATLQFRGITPPSAAVRAYLFGAGFATGTGVLAAIVLG